MRARISAARLGLPIPKMNNLEARYAREILWARYLSGEIVWFKHEPMKLQLAHLTTYTPDWGALRSDGGFELHEVKQVWVAKDGKSERVGYVEDARVKVKLAAHAFPMFEFTVAAYRAASRKHRLPAEWKYDHLQVLGDWSPGDSTP